MTPDCFFIDTLSIEGVYDTEDCTGAERGSRGGPGASTAAEREASTICPLSLAKNHKKF